MFCIFAFAPDACYACSATLTVPAMLATLARMCTHMSSGVVVIQSMYRAIGTSVPGWVRVKLRMRAKAG